MKLTYTEWFLHFARRFLTPCQSAVLSDAATHPRSVIVDRAQRCGLAVSTTAKALQALERRGFLARVRVDGLTPTYRVVTVEPRPDAEDADSRAAVASLRRFRGATGTTRPEPTKTRSGGL